MKKKKIISCTVGICVYNEEKNISHVLESLLSQKLHRVSVKEILIVAYATDSTYKIVKKFTRANKKIRLIKQKKREGKAGAVNHLIEISKSDVLVLLGGDVILTPHVIEYLVSPFLDTALGMTGARPIPVNDIHDGFCGFSAHLLWELHHQISLKQPKMGEVIAFRRVFRRIPILSSVDEANIEPLIRGQGYTIRYVPHAVVHNKGPMTVSDFVRQRRRIYNGHLAVKYEQSYVVSTMNSTTLIPVVFGFLSTHRNIKFFFLTPFVILLEGWSRVLGWWDYTITKKRYTIWDAIKTTKDLRRGPFV